MIRKNLSKSELSNLLNDAIHEKDAVIKGEKFEYFFESLVGQQEGFKLIKRHCRSDVGEIDYFYRSELCGHPLWDRFPYLFIECKNWKEKISSEKMDHFVNLLEAKNFFPCCFGIYITTSSFSSHAIKAAEKAIQNRKQLIILIEKKDLANVLQMGFRDFLQEKCDQILSKM